MSGVERQAIVRCVTGHDIPADRFQESTTILSLDSGAEVRVCVEHGAPVSVDYLPRMSASRNAGDSSSN